MNQPHATTNGEGAKLRVRLPQIPRCVCFPPTIACMICTLACLVLSIGTWADVAVWKQQAKSLTEENVAIRARLNAAATRPIVQDEQ